jgi:hypothetical protein
MEYTNLQERAAILTDSPLSIGILRLSLRSPNLAGSRLRRGNLCSIQRTFQVLPILFKPMTSTVSREFGLSIVLIRLSSSCSILVGV